MNNTNDNENLYVSSELSEVIDLVLKRQKLLQHIRSVGSDKHLQDETYHMVVADCIIVTAKLETLVAKED